MHFRCTIYKQTHKKLINLCRFFVLGIQFESRSVFPFQTFKIGLIFKWIMPEKVTHGKCYRTLSESLSLNSQNKAVAIISIDIKTVSWIGIYSHKWFFINDNHKKNQWKTKKRSYNTYSESYIKLFNYVYITHAFVFFLQNLSWNFQHLVIGFQYLPYQNFMHREYMCSKYTTNPLMNEIQVN